MLRSLFFYISIHGWRGIALKHSILTWLWNRKSLIDAGLSAAGFTFLAGRVPYLRAKHPWMNPRKNYLTNLPIHADIQPEGTALPPQVVAALIRTSRHHVILEECICRHGRGCRNYPDDIGCLLLGESALDVPPRFSRRVTGEEALRHLERAVKAGLVPMAAKARIDNYAFLLPDRGTLLGICFCCHCCCIMGYCRHIDTRQLDVMFPRLEGLEIDVNDRCAGCGTCAETCYMRAITIKNNRAVHSEKCRGCGRCVDACPRGAVDIRITNPEYTGISVQRFLGRAKID